MGEFKMRCTLSLKNRFINTHFLSVRHRIVVAQYTLFGLLSHKSGHVGGHTAMTTVADAIYTSGAI